MVQVGSGFMSPGPSKQRDAGGCCTACGREPGCAAWSWHVNDVVCAGGGAEKLCAAALALHGVCEVAVEEFVRASVSYDDKREFWCELNTMSRLMQPYVIAILETGAVKSDFKTTFA